MLKLEPLRDLQILTRARFMLKDQHVVPMKGKERPNMHEMSCF